MPGVNAGPPLTLNETLSFACSSVRRTNAADEPTEVHAFMPSSWRAANESVESGSLGSCETMGYVHAFGAGIDRRR
jgi:hypothetical protein